MSDHEVRNTNLDLIAYFVEKILNIIKTINNQEEQPKRQKGQGLKMLTPQQTITRLPILLAQLKAGNNSQKLKNERRQLLYSLYRSKKLSRTIYNSLMNTILKWEQYL